MNFAIEFLRRALRTIPKGQLDLYHIELNPINYWKIKNLHCYSYVLEVEDFKPKLGKRNISFAWVDPKEALTWDKLDPLTKEAIEKYLQQ